MAKSGCDFTFLGVGGGVEVSVIISIQCLTSAGYGVFHCGKRVIPLRDMGYSSEGYGVFRRWIWGIPLLDMGYSTAGYGICCYLGLTLNT